MACRIGFDAPDRHHDMRSTPKALLHCIEALRIETACAAVATALIIDESGR